MSYDVSTESVGRGREAVDWNYTYNVQPMLLAAGLRSIHDLDGVKAGVAGLAIAGLLVRMDAEPERFRALNPPNGWGDYDELHERLRALRDALLADPDAIVRVT